MAMAGTENPEAAAEAERAKAREGMKAHRECEKETQSQVTANVSGSDQGDPEVSAEMMKAKFAGAAHGDEEDDGPDNQTKQPPRSEVSKLVRVWVEASPEAKREFVRECWDEIALARKQLDANGASHEDRWIEGDTV
jgi:hypothetical protein